MKKIMLIADDIEVNRVVLRGIFENEYTVVDVIDGEQAIEMINIHRNNIAIILLDILMPKIDGFGVLNFINNDKQLIEIPVVMITDVGENEIRALRSGAWDFIPKPYNPDIVRSRVDNAIKKSKLNSVSKLRKEKNNNKKLKLALDEANRANKVKTEFLARMSHEIRTPINVIMGMAEITSQNIDDKAQILDCMEKTQMAANFLLGIVNDILDMSKIENDKIALANKAIIFDDFLNNINTLMSIRSKKSGIIYNFESVGNFKKCYYCDEIKLQQALINIINNALKFTSIGGNVDFKVIAKETLNDYTDIDFIVSDTGIGISEEFIPKIFDAFSQEQTGNNSVYSGVGLGLSISNRIVNLMGGKIDIKSQKGKGTTFTVSTKLNIAPDFHKKVNHKNFDFKGKKVLLVEDNELNILVAKKLLENKNFVVDIAINGEIAVNKFSNSEICYYDIILMDIRMPKMDGLEATKQIRASQRIDAKDVKIIALSANAFDEDVNQSIEAGMNAYVAKPIVAQILYQTLDDLLKG